MCHMSYGELNTHLCRCVNCIGLALCEAMLTRMTLNYVVRCVPLTNYTNGLSIIKQELIITQSAHMRFLY